MHQDLKQVIDEVIKRHELQLPPVAQPSACRLAYLNFLDRLGLSEMDVAPMVDKNKLGGEVYAQIFLAFMEAERTSNKEELVRIISLIQATLLDKNANDLMGVIVNKLFNDFSTNSIDLPELYAGVFPTDSINAQCVLEDKKPLVLIDTGLFELIEFAITTFVSKRNETEQAELLIQALEDYYIRKISPDPEIADHPSINWGTTPAYILITAVEEFVIMHEIAHILLHLDTPKLTPLPVSGSRQISVLHKDHFEEYQADTYALDLLIKRAKGSEQRDLALDLSCSGALIFIYIGVMLEALAESRNVVKNTVSHPPIENRVYLLELTMEVLGVHEHSSIARKFKRILRELCVLEEVEEKVPPLLSRDLNKIAIEIYDSLDIDYSHAGFVTNFQ